MYSLHSTISYAESAPILQWWIWSLAPKTLCESWTTCSTGKWRRSCFRKLSMAPHRKEERRKRYIQWLVKHCLWSFCPVQPSFCSFVIFYTAENRKRPWHLFLFVCLCRKQSSTSCRRAQWTVWRALSLCPLCPSAPAPRAPQSTAWPMALMTVLRWPWCRRESRQSRLTAPSFTAPLYVISAVQCTVFWNGLFLD